MRYHTTRLLPLAALFFLLVCGHPLFAQLHSHYAAGVLDSNSNGQADAGEPLQFLGVNGTEKILHMLPQPVGNRPTQRCGGYYVLDEQPRTLSPADSFSFIAKPAFNDLDTAGHAHLGAQIWLEIVGITGPAGAKFAFWDENQSFFYDTPTIVFDTNQPTGNYQILLSEGPDSAGEDPGGHIHNRSWTADKPGDYYMSVRLVDLSTNRPGGGPWHTPSQVYTYRFQAGPSFQPSGAMVAGGYKLTWASQMGHYAPDTAQHGVVFGIERTTTLAPNSWQQIGTVTGTTADTATFTDPSPPAGKAIYRLKYLWSTP